MCLRILFPSISEPAFLIFSKKVKIVVAYFSYSYIMKNVCSNVSSFLVSKIQETSPSSIQIKWLSVLSNFQTFQVFFSLPLFNYCLDFFIFPYTLSVKWASYCVLQYRADAKRCNSLQRKFTLQPLRSYNVASQKIALTWIGYTNVVCRQYNDSV